MISFKNFYCLLFVILMSFSVKAGFIPDAIGISGGATYGSGISAQWKSRDKLRFSLATLPIRTKDWTYFNLGVSSQYDFHKGKYGAAFLSFGVLYSYEYQYYPPLMAQLDPRLNEWASNSFLRTALLNEPQVDKNLHSVSFGPGIGMRFDFMSNFRFTIGVPLCLKINKEETKFWPIPNATILYIF